MYLKAEEICEALKQGKDVTADIAKIEPELKGYYKKRKKSLKNDNNGYYVLSFHLVDEEHGYGAALLFDAFNKASEYHDEKRKSRGVYLYRFKYLMLFEHVPESW